MVRWTRHRSNVLTTRPDVSEPGVSCGDPIRRSARALHPKLSARVAGSFPDPRKIGERLEHGRNRESIDDAEAADGVRRSFWAQTRCDLNSRSCVLLPIRDARRHTKCRAAYLGEHSNALTDLLLGRVGETKAHLALTVGAIRRPLRARVDCDAGRER